jgi:molecular chaperone Hsp33
VNEVQTFLLEDAGVRGALVRLRETWRHATAQHNYPAEIQRVLGEGMAAAVLLTTGLKGSPSLSLQLQSDGPLRLLLVQCSADLKVRGLAQGRVPEAGRGLLGQGRLTVNLGSESAALVSQGIVPLVGNSLEQSLEAYFLQSEQLATRLVLRGSKDRIAGMLLQSIPGRDAAQASFSGLSALLQTVSREALDHLAAEQLLPELFQDQAIRLFPARDVGYDCRCTPQHLAGILRILGADELHSIVSEQGQVELTCEFCNRAFRFQPSAIDAILDGADAVTALH